MFAPNYFAPNYYAQRYWPPALFDIEIDLPGSGSGKAKATRDRLARLRREDEEILRIVIAATIYGLLE